MKREKKTKSQDTQKSTQENTQSQKFEGLFPGPHGLYYRESPQAREQRAAERRVKEQDEWERFRASCEKCCQLLANPGTREYWINQAELAFNNLDEWWGDIKLDWQNPTDKAIVYAIMLLCIEQYSVMTILPELFRQSKAYEANRNIWFWVQNSELAAEFLAYIEADLLDNRAGGQEQEQKSTKASGGKVDSLNEKSSETWYWKLYEKTIKAVIAAILDKVNPP